MSGLSAPIGIRRQSRWSRVMSTKSEALKKRMIRRHELRQLVPLADTTIYEMEQRGEFPRRFALTPRCVEWDLAEVEAWLTERLATARRSPIDRARSEEHTSELQSLMRISYAVFCLKKK